MKGVVFVKCENNCALKKTSSVGVLCSYFRKKEKKPDPELLVRLSCRERIRQLSNRLMQGTGVNRHAMTIVVHNIL